MTIKSIVFKIEEEVFSLFPDLVVGWVVAKGINNNGKSNNLRGLIQEVQERIRGCFVTETLSQHPKIQAWRGAYSAFGAKPKKYKSSVESLFRMTLKGIELKPINRIVDIYNYISLKHIIPAGGDDLDKVEGNISLARAQGNEVFVPLNSEISDIVNSGEVVYKDRSEILCRRWNWRECNKTKMTSDTKNVLLVVEGLLPFDRLSVQPVLQELGQLVKEGCGGKIQTGILDITSREFTILIGQTD